MPDCNTELWRTSGNPGFQAKAGSKKPSQSKHIFPTFFLMEHITFTLAKLFCFE